MRARDVMTTNVVTVAPTATVTEVANTLLKRRVSAVPVVDAKGRLVGIISEGDLMRRPEIGTERQRSWWLRLVSEEEELAREFIKTHARSAREVMTRRVVTVGPAAPVARIAELLEEHHIKRVPVVRAGRLVGIVARADLLRALATAKPAAAAAGDRALRTRVQRALDETQAIGAVNVSVVVRKGVVHLWGLVGSSAARRALGIACENVAGVRGVENHLGIFRYAGI